MKLSKIHNYLKDLGDDTNVNKDQEIDTKLIKEASHAKINKFALFLCELFALDSVTTVYSNDEYRDPYHRYTGTKDALTRMVKFIDVAVWGQKSFSSSEIQDIKNGIKPTKDKNLFYVDIDPHGSRDSVTLENIEKNLFIEPRNMKRVIDKVVG